MGAIIKRFPRGFSIFEIAKGLQIWSSFNHEKYKLKAISKNKAVAHLGIYYQGNFFD